MNIVNPNSRTTLLLNKSWMPINIMTAKTACKKMINGQITIIDKFANTHRIGRGGATIKNLEEFEWLADKHVLDATLDYSIEDSCYVIDQPILRSAHDFWPIPTVALAETNFFRKLHQKGKPSIQLLAKVYKNTCQICGGKFPTSQLTIEHVYPKSKGGTHEEWNVLPTCQECNRLKADIHPYFDAHGKDLEKKIKRIPIFFTPHSSDMREEWEKFIFTNV